MTETAKDSYYDSITKNTDKDIMDAVGEKGCWQFGISVQIFFIMSVLAIHNFSMSFLAPNQDYWCANPPDVTNNSIQYWKNMTTSKGDEHCYRYNISSVTDSAEYNSSAVQLTQCIAFEYDKTFYTSTLVSKWNLVCDRKWLISLAKSIFMFGILVSNVLFGHLSDRFGRKPIIISCSIITAFFSFVSAFCTSISSFIILRFLTGVGLGGYYNTAFVLLMEIVVPKMRAVYGLGMQLGWSLGFVCLPGIAWIFRDVFWLQIALAVPAIIQAICLGFIPESPRWLLSYGRVEEAREVLLRAMKRNKLPLNDLELARTFQIAEINIKHETEKHDELNKLLQLLKSSSLRRMTIFLFLIWFVISFVYYGFSFNTNELSGNPFANFALSGATEFPAYISAMFIIHYIGRKKPLATAMIVGGVTYIILNLIPIDSSALIVAAAMIAKFFITCAYGILYVFTTELFPTVVRNIGLGLSTVFEGLGSILAPFMRELGNATHPAIPQFLFGILSVVGGSLVLFLRETNNQIIPDTLEEAIEIFRREEQNSTSLKENKLVIPEIKR